MSKEVIHHTKSGRCYVEIVRQQGQKGAHYSVRPFREYSDPDTGDTHRALNYFKRDRKDCEKAISDAWEWIDNTQATQGQQNGKQGG